MQSVDGTINKEDIKLVGSLIERAVKSVGGTINKEDIKLVGTLIERAVSWIFNRKGSQLDL